ncbi:MAG: hypothetical protein ACI3W6_09265 [Clostridia bacterium]
MIRQKLWTSLILLFGMSLLTACSSSCAVQPEEEEKATESDSGSVRSYVSDLGYSMDYDSSVFFVLSDENSDSFGLWNEDVDAELSVSITVERVSGYTVNEYAAYITDRVAGGVWSLTEAEFGKNRKKATTVTYEEDTGGGEVYYNDTLVKAGKDILVIKMVTYEGLPGEVNGKINEMLSTFEVD